MDGLELEFFKMKQNGQFATKPNLLDENFAMGTKAIINAIANSAKTGFFSGEQADAMATLQQVYDGCKLVKTIF